MKIQGCESLKYTIPIEFEIGKKTLILNCSPVPFDFLDHLEREIPSPHPPRIGMILSRQGRPAVDENGNPIIEYNEQDPAYLAKLREVDNLHHVVIAYVALKDCSEVEFEAEYPTEKNANYKTFYKKIQKELQDFGFSAGHMKRIKEGVQGDKNFIDVAKKNSGTREREQ